MSKIKFSSCIFVLILFIQIAAAAEGDAVTISGGNLAVFGDSVSTIETPGFAASGWFGEQSESAWYGVCSSIGQIYSGGSTFRLPFHTGIGQNIGTALPFESGNITVGGQTYTNVFYSGNLYFGDSAFADDMYVTIPKFFNQRRKGTYTITRPFTLHSNSTIKVCTVSMLGGPCPAQNLVLDTKLQGKGTLVITLRYNAQSPDSPNNLYPRLIRKTFDYRFES